MVVAYVGTRYVNSLVLSILAEGLLFTAGLRVFGVFRLNKHKVGFNRLK